jgi:hypothetical protein
MHRQADTGQARAWRKGRGMGRERPRLCTQLRIGKTQVEEQSRGRVAGLLTDSGELQKDVGASPPTHANTPHTSSSETHGSGQCGVERQGVVGAARTTHAHRRARDTAQSRKGGQAQCTHTPSFQARRWHSPTLARARCTYTHPQGPPTHHAVCELQDEEDDEVGPALSRAGSLDELHQGCRPNLRDATHSHTQPSTHT